MLRNIMCFVLADGSSIISEVIEDIDTQAGEIREYLKLPAEVVEEQNNKVLYEWPLVVSEDDLYPIPPHLIKYVPNKEACKCYNEARPADQPSNTKLN